jgi:hypothetical protein
MQLQHFAGQQGLTITHPPVFDCEGQGSVELKIAKGFHVKKILPRSAGEHPIDLYSRF